MPHLQATGVCVGVGGAEDAGAMGSGDGLRNLAAGALKGVSQGGHRMYQKQAGGEGQEEVWGERDLLQGLTKPLPHRSVDGPPLW